MYLSAANIMLTLLEPKFLPACSLARSYFIFEVATIFMALVIFRMLFTVFILCLSSFSEAAKKRYCVGTINWLEARTFLLSRGLAHMRYSCDCMMDCKREINNYKLL